MLSRKVPYKNRKILIALFFVIVVYWYMMVLHWKFNLEKFTVLFVDNKSSCLFGPFFMLFNILIGQLLLHARKKKIARLNTLKTWDYKGKVWSILIIMLIAIGMCCFKIFKISSDDIMKALFISLFSSLSFACLKQREGYKKFEINDSQKCEKSIGAFWAQHAYDSYYKIVLHDLLERIAQFEKEFDIKLLTNKLVLVIPTSCNVTNNLIEKDAKLNYFSDLPIIECDQGANINRKYKNPIYKISSVKDLYLAFEFPSSVLTLWNSKDNMDAEILNYHLKCFTATIELLVKDDPAIVIKYNDTIDSPEPLHSVLISNVTKIENTIISMEF